MLPFLLLFRTFSRVVYFFTFSKYFSKGGKNQKRGRVICFFALSAKLKKCGARKGQKARISRFITRYGHTAANRWLFVQQQIVLPHSTARVQRATYPPHLLVQHCQFCVHHSSSPLQEASPPWGRERRRRRAEEANARR